MKFLVALMGLVAFAVLASDAAAQGGSVGSRTRFVVRDYAVQRAVPVREVTRLRRVWVPRRTAALGGSNGSNVSVQVGGSTGTVGTVGGSTSYGLGAVSPVVYAAPVAVAAANVSVSVDIQQHSLRQAASNRMFHSRGPWANGARYEGVGFSTRSARSALENCCYYGEKALVEQSVVQGSGGWYATARFR